MPVTKTKGRKKEFTKQTAFDKVIEELKILCLGLGAMA